MKNGGNAMQDEQQDIVKRSFQYSLRIIKLYREIEKDSVGRIIGKQVLRSGTSIGANVHEAQGAQSKADFIAKMSIAHKEAYETSYWLHLVQEAKLVPSSRLDALLDETDQIVRMLSSILITSKQQHAKPINREN
jgi:four helix bundle protein